MGPETKTDLRKNTFAGQISTTTTTLSSPHSDGAFDVGQFDPGGSASVDKFPVDESGIALQVGGVEVDHGDVVFGNSQHATSEHLEKRDICYKDGILQRGKWSQSETPQEVDLTIYDIILQGELE